ncbi:hypothetical protein D3C72_1871310 [compost metagenome]
MGVQHAGSVVPRGMDSGMDHISGGIQAEVAFRAIKHLAIQVDLVQAGCRDFLVQQPVWVDQNIFRLARHARGDVVVDQVGHAVEMDGAVERRQFHASLPLSLGDRWVTREWAGGLDCCHAGSGQFVLRLSSAMLRLSLANCSAAYF